MSVDVSPLLELVAALADELEDDHGDHATVKAAVVIVELVPNDDGPVGSIVEHRATVRSTAHVLGLVELTSDSLRVDYVRDDPDDS